MQLTVKGRCSSRCLKSVSGRYSHASHSSLLDFTLRRYQKVRQIFRFNLGNQIGFLFTTFMATVSIGPHLFKNGSPSIGLSLWFRCFFVHSQWREGEARPELGMDSSAPQTSPGSHSPADCAVSPGCISPGSRPPPPALPSRSTVVPGSSIRPGTVHGNNFVM
jgi:hypothetical protein